MLRANSKGIIVMSMSVWLFARILYFSVSLFPIKPSETIICLLEVGQNLPVFCMYICMLVFQRFLLNMYTVMLKRERSARLRRVNVYFWVMASIYLCSQSIQTGLICADYSVMLDSSTAGRGNMIVIGSECVIGISLVFNSAISIMVIPEMRRQAQFKLISWFTIFMCAAFEMNLLYRAWIVYSELDIKRTDPALWRKVMISYFACFELPLYLFVIAQIMYQTYTRYQLGKKRTNQYKSINTPQSSSVMQSPSTLDIRQSCNLKPNDFLLASTMSNMQDMAAT